MQPKLPPEVLALLRRYKQFKPFLELMLDPYFDELKAGEDAVDTCGLIDTVIVKELFEFDSVVERMLTGGNPLESIHNIAHLCFLLGRSFELHPVELPARRAESTDDAPAEADETNPDAGSAFNAFIDGLGNLGL